MDNFETYNRHFVHDSAAGLAADNLYLAPSCNRPSVSSTARSSESTTRTKASSRDSDHRSSHESKPRLSKEQQDILESHFQRQPKPTTSVKRGFSESLGVPLDKINVCLRPWPHP